MVRHKTGGSTTYSLTLNRRQKRVVAWCVVTLVLLGIILAQLVNQGSGAAFLGGSSRLSNSECADLNVKRLNGSATDGEVDTFAEQCTELINLQVGQ